MNNTGLAVKRSLFDPQDVLVLWQKIRKLYDMIYIIASFINFLHFIFYIISEYHFKYCIKKTLSVVTLPTCEKGPEYPP